MAVLANKDFETPDHVLEAVAVQQTLFDCQFVKAGELTGKDFEVGVSPRELAIFDPHNCAMVLQAFDLESFETCDQGSEVICADFIRIKQDVNYCEEL